MLDNRARILDAAARVYAEFGYRGATTRRIAVAAGVNEVTLFRTFGSKAALIDEAVRCCAASSVASRSALPELPVDPERELTEWAGALLQHLRETRSLMRKSMSEVEERPDMAPCMAAGVSLAADELRTYMRRLGELGFVDWRALGTDDVDADGSDDGSDDPGPRSADRAKMQPADAAAAAVAVVERVDSVRAEDAYAAGTMLMAALFSDAMGRDLMPGLYPEPADRAPALYVRLFLRAVRCSRTPRRRARPTSSARTSKVRS
ncbi:regulatory protein TetR [Gemmatirosa kalamazoonensis]|uniref:Regulatory protein TetR n=1 Tax=Gemmatirosa kalamazoonensis TaxID=861299 RepID=W0RFH6_9BACT|nr:TetR/AcrR family transcriptional regulator [Gemmatirosa kalamazoonensis]AHG89551.1 regulatory protein TetR [Gemmatirosa kalamazoonensis]